MNVIIDLLLIGVLVLCIWNGYRKGLILGISGILALIIAFYGANFIAKNYSSEFVSIVKPLISGLVDNAVDDASEEHQSDPENIQDSDEAYEVSYDSLKKMGFLGSAAAELSDEIKEDVAEFGHSIKTAIIHKLSGTIAYVATLIIVFILILILFTVLAHIINLAFKLPGLEILNGIGGAIFGLLKGLIIIFALSWVLRFVGFIIPESTVDKTYVLKWLMNHNPVLMLFSN